MTTFRILRLSLLAVLIGFAGLREARGQQDLEAVLDLRHQKDFSLGDTFLPSSGTTKHDLVQGTRQSDTSKSMWHFDSFFGDSSESISRALSLDVQTSARVAFKAMSFENDVNFKIIRDAQSTSRRVVYYVLAEKYHGFEQVLRPKLSEKAEKDLAQISADKKAEWVRENWGTAYLRSEHKASLLLVRFEMFKNKQISNEDLEALWKGSFKFEPVSQGQQGAPAGGAGGGAGGLVQIKGEHKIVATSTLSRLLESVQINVNAWGFGGEGLETVAEIQGAVDNVGKVVEAINNQLHALNDSAKGAIIGYTLGPLSDVEGLAGVGIPRSWPEAGSRIQSELYLNYVEIDRAKQFIKRCREAQPDMSRKAYYELLDEKYTDLAWQYIEFGGSYDPVALPSADQWLRIRDLLARRVTLTDSEAATLGRSGGGKVALPAIRDIVSSVPPDFLSFRILRYSRSSYTFNIHFDLKSNGQTLLSCDDNQVRMTPDVQNTSSSLSQGFRVPSDIEQLQIEVSADPQGTRDKAKGTGRFPSVQREQLVQWFSDPAVTTSPELKTTVDVPVLGPIDMVMTFNRIR